MQSARDSGESASSSAQTKQTISEGFKDKAFDSVYVIQNLQPINGECYPAGSEARYDNYAVLLGLYGKYLVNTPRDV